MPSKKKAQRQTAGGDHLPKNWPKDIPYLTDHTFSSAVTTDQLVALSRSTSESESYAKIPAELLKTPYSWVEIITINDPAHPAHGQRGLFAKQHLDPDALICLYLGHVHTNSLSDTDPYSDYDLSYDRENGLSIDAAKSGSEGRFVRESSITPMAISRSIFRDKSMVWTSCLLTDYPLFTGKRLQNHCRSAKR